MTKLISNVKIQGKIYDTSHISDDLKIVVSEFEFCRAKIREMENMLALLQRAKKSYVEEINLEVLRNKSGLV